MKMDMIDKRDLEGGNNFQYLSFDINDRKVMTVDSTKFADLLYLLPKDNNNKIDEVYIGDNESPNDLENTHQSDVMLESSKNILEYRKQLESMIQAESKLHYELQKLKSVIQRQKTSSKKKNIHVNTHNRIAEIEAKIATIVNQSNTYYKSICHNITQINSLNANHDSNSSKESAVKEVQQLVEFDASKDFIERGSHMIQNLFSRSTRSTSTSDSISSTITTASTSDSKLMHKGTMSRPQLPKLKLSRMEETWERVILAERMRRVLLLQPEMDLLLATHKEDVSTDDTDIGSAVRLRKLIDTVSRVSSDIQQQQLPLSLIPPVSPPQSPLSSLSEVPVVEKKNHTAERHLVRSYVRRINSKTFQLLH